MCWFCWTNHGFVTTFAFSYPDISVKGWRGPLASNRAMHSWCVKLFHEIKLPGESCYDTQQYLPLFRMHPAALYLSPSYLLSAPICIFLIQILCWSTELAFGITMVCTLRIGSGSDINWENPLQCCRATFSLPSYHVPSSSHKSRGAQCCKIWPILFWLS